MAVLVVLPLVSAPNASLASTWTPTIVLTVILSCLAVSSATQTPTVRSAITAICWQPTDLVTPARIHMMAVTHAKLMLACAALTDIT